MKNEIVLQLEGKTDDLLIVSNPTNDLSMKGTRLVKIDPTSTEINEEIVDIAVTSTNRYDEHPLFDKLLGKKIRMTVEILEDE